ncbi:MAG: winged helix-turn-helix domain-containing protein [Promethearchaeota archaeon]
MEQKHSDEPKKKEFSEKEKKPSTVDILKNKTRFMIHSLLSIYPELSLKQLSKYLGKSKSAIHNHIKLMIEAEIVKKTREEEVRSDKKRFYYSLTEDADDKTEIVGKCKDECVTLEQARFIDKIDTHLSFTKNKIKIMSYWMEYLEHIRTQVLEAGKNSGIESLRILENSDLSNLSENKKNLENNPNLENLNSIMKKFNAFSEQRQIFTSVSYYSPELAKNCSKKYYEIYSEMEKLARKEAENNSGRTRPVYASMTLLPVMEVLEFIKEREIKKKAKK